MARVEGSTPVYYVRNLPVSQAFFELLGYEERRAGTSPQGSYSYLICGTQTLVLASIDPCPVAGELPLSLYLWMTDVLAAQRTLTAAGYRCEHVGNPAHAPGGEVRCNDPDGNVVLLGQAVVTDKSGKPTESTFSLLQEAAARNARRLVDKTCQINNADGSACNQHADVKLADPSGATLWGCLPHSEEALLEARSAFIATEDDFDGLSHWLRRRHAAHNDR